MNEDDLTPTKTISRVNISPKSKETVCILCVEAVWDQDYRHKLFSGSNKSQACVNLETLVDTKLHWGNSVTEIICRNCARTNENVVKKILEIRQQFLSSKERLAAHCGTVDSVKRRSKASLDQVVRGILKTKSFVRWKQRYCRYRRTCSIGHINREVYSNFVLARKKFWWVCRSCKWKFQTVRIARFCSWLRNHKTCVNISPKF